MEELKDTFELPVSENPYQNEFLMDSLKGLLLSYKIVAGYFIIEYENALDIYKLGLRMAAYYDREFKSKNHPGLPNPYYNGKK